MSFSVFCLWHTCILNMRHRSSFWFLTTCFMLGKKVVLSCSVPDQRNICAALKMDSSDNLSCIPQNHVLQKAYFIFHFYAPIQYQKEFTFHAFSCSWKILSLEILYSSKESPVWNLNRENVTLRLSNWEFDGHQALRLFHGSKFYLMATFCVQPKPNYIDMYRVLFTCQLCYFNILICIDGSKKYMGIWKKYKGFPYFL